MLSGVRALRRHNADFRILRHATLLVMLVYASRLLKSKSFDFTVDITAA